MQMNGRSKYAAIILTRAVRQLDRRVEIEGKLRPSVPGRVYQLVAERGLAESDDNAPLTERCLTGVWASRAQLLGAYAFAADVLSRGRAEPPTALFLTTRWKTTLSRNPGILRAGAVCRRSKTALCVAPAVLCGAAVARCAGSWPPREMPRLKISSSRGSPGLYERGRDPK